MSARVAFCKTAGQTKSHLMLMLSIADLHRCKLFSILVVFCVCSVVVYGG